MICKFGPIVSDARGALGGVVFSRSRSGAFARSNRVPVFNFTNKRNEWSSIMSQVYARWLTVLNIAQRAAWNTLGDNTTFTNALGKDYHPSGWNLYLRTNSLWFRWSGAFIDAAPANAVNAHFLPSYSWDAGNHEIQCTAPGGAPATDIWFTWVSYPARRTIYHFPRLSWFFEKETADDYKGTVSICPSGMYDDGDRAFIRDRQMGDDGSLTASFYQSFDVDDP